MPRHRDFHEKLISSMAMATVVVAILEPNEASAANRTRPRFEPTDLQIVAPGELGVDLQIGMVRGPAATRVEVPDVEINLGLAPRVELDLDLTYALEGPFAAIHSAPDNAWLSSKIGLLDLRDSDTARTAWAFGVQLGPRLPMASGARGAGYEVLLLVGRAQDRLHLVGNFGALVDPGLEVSQKRPIGGIVALDAAFDLDQSGRFSLLGELAGVVHLSNDPHELQGTLGVQWSPTSRLAFSTVGLLGFTSGSDRFGLLFGATYRFRLWE